MKSRFWALLARWAVGLALTSVGWVPEVGSEEIPGQLRTLIGSENVRVVSVSRWSAMRNHPAVTRLRELYELGVEVDLDQMSLLWEPAIVAIPNQPVHESEIIEIWMIVTKAHALRFDSAWIRTDLSDEQLLTEIGQSGWIELCQFEPCVFAQPLDPSNERDAGLIEQLDQLPPDNREPALARILTTQKYTVTPIGNGWLVLSPPGRWFRFGSDRKRGKGSDDAGLDFPFDGLFNLPEAVLTAVAFDNAANDGGAFESSGPQFAEPSQVTLRQLEERLKSLRDGPEATAASMLPDMFITVSETDGGVTIDCVGRPRIDDQVPVVSAFMEAVMAITRMVVAHSSPALFHELGAARVVARDEIVEAQLELSSASVLDAIENEAARQMEMIDLRHRIREIEIDRLAVDHPGGP